MWYPDFPEPNMDPPEEPEIPAPDGPCMECGKNNWGDAEQRRGTWIYQCMTELTCGTCLGNGLLDGANREDAEVVLAKIEDDPDDRCEECSGKGTVLCGGDWEFTEMTEADADDDRDD